MKLLFLLVKELERKPESGTNSFITDIIPTFDYIKDHLEKQLQVRNIQTFIKKMEL
jgi:hypothetical protein